MSKFDMGSSEVEFDMSFWSKVTVDMASFEK